MITPDDQRWYCTEQANLELFNWFDWLGGEIPTPEQLADVGYEFPTKTLPWFNEQAQYFVALGYLNDPNFINPYHLAFRMFCAFIRKHSGVTEEQKQELMRNIDIAAGIDKIGKLYADFEKQIRRDWNNFVKQDGTWNLLLRICY